MSVLVKGMEIPKDCRECRLMEYHSNSGETWCAPAVGLLAVNFEPIPFDGRPDWCPLVELPEKHGRLIDADNLKTWFGEKDLYSYDYITGIIDDERTVVEAEGEG